MHVSPVSLIIAVGFPGLVLLFGCSLGMQELKQRGDLRWTLSFCSYSSIVVLFPSLSLRARAPWASTEQGGGTRVTQAPTIPQCQGLARVCWVENFSYAKACLFMDESKAVATWFEAVLDPHSGSWLEILACCSAKAHLFSGNCCEEMSLHPRKKKHQVLGQVRASQRLLRSILRS